MGIGSSEFCLGARRKGYPNITVSVIVSGSPLMIRVWSGVRKLATARTKNKGLDTSTAKFDLLGIAAGLDCL